MSEVSKGGGKLVSESELVSVRQVSGKLLSE